MFQSVCTGVEEGKKIMAKDLFLLEDYHEKTQHGEILPPLLHLYEWKRPTITYGHFLKPEQFFDVEALADRGIVLAKRPTGGGVTFHLWDVAFSLIIPASSPFYSDNTEANYQGINRRVLEAVEAYRVFRRGEGNDLQHNTMPQDELEGSSEGTSRSRECKSTKEGLILMGGTSPRNDTLSHFCMGRATPYDVIAKDKKIAGAAQRRKKGALLHQGSISWTLPDWELLQAIFLQKVLEEDNFLSTMEQVSPVVEKDPTPFRRDKLLSFLLEMLEKGPL